jgi:hypothetical protein
LSRYQFFNKIFLNGFSLYDFNYIKVRYAKAFSIFSLVLTTAISKRLSRYYLYKNFKIQDKIYKNTNSTVGFLAANEKLEENPNILPIHSIYNKNLYPFDIVEFFDLNTTHALTFSLSLNLIKEVYKIATALAYLKLKR